MCRDAHPLGSSHARMAACWLFLFLFVCVFSHFFFPVSFSSLVKSQCLPGSILLLYVVANGRTCMHWRQPDASHTVLDSRCLL